MLLFWDEEHVDRWCRQWQLPRGAILSLERAWQLAAAWFAADRTAPDWQRQTVEEAEALLTSLDLTGPFWSLR
jgi:hypothetical protein